MKLTNEELVELKNILSSTPSATDTELQLLKKRAPGVYHSDTFGKGEYGIEYYTLKHKPLNNFLFKITNYDSDYLTTLHKIHYIKGSKVTEHVDYSDLTCVIMLENNSEGGDFLFNKEKIQFKETGEYLLYNGGETLHEVTEIISGNRDVLVIWYRNNTSNTKSII